MSGAAERRGELRHLLLLAWRNLARHRRRTVITMLALAFSIAVLIFMDSMLRGIDEESQRNLVWYETGSGRVVTRAQHDDLDRVALKHELVDYRRLAAALAESGNCQHAAHQLHRRDVLRRGLVADSASSPSIRPPTGRCSGCRTPCLPAAAYLEPGVPGLILACLDDR